MRGLGTIINVAAILLGGVIGMMGGRLLKERFQNIIMQAMGVCVMFIGISGTLEEMITVNDGILSGGGTIMMVTSFALGSLIGEMIDLDSKISKFGEWLKKKSGSSKDKTFVDGFVTASITVCVGAMTIVGSVEDGISGDYSVLGVKALLDFIIIIIMTVSLGKGCMFSALPVGIIQGLITAFAVLIKPYLTEPALSNLSFTGSMLIFCVGVNLIWKNKIKVANMVPTIFVAVLWAFLPF